MTTEKKLGICMDHATAHLIEFTDASANEFKEIDSDFTSPVKVDIMDKGQKTLHNTQQHDHAKYYKEIATAMEGYSAVLLFGATEAKTELLNLLKKDHHFDNIKIGVEQTDRMTENQEHAFVKAYFSKN